MNCIFRMECVLVEERQCIVSGACLMRERIECDFFFFSSRRRHTRSSTVSWGSEMCIRDSHRSAAARVACSRSSKARFKLAVCANGVKQSVIDLSLIHI